MEDGFYPLSHLPVLRWDLDATWHQIVYMEFSEQGFSDRWRDPNPGLLQFTSWETRGVAVGPKSDSIPYGFTYSSTHAAR